MFSVIHYLAELIAYENQVNGSLPGNFVQPNLSVGSSPFPNCHTFFISFAHLLSVFPNILATLNIS
jgi:hypothetical protein